MFEKSCYNQFSIVLGCSCKEEFNNSNYYKLVSQDKEEKQKERLLCVTNTVMQSCKTRIKHCSLVSLGRSLCHLIRRNTQLNQNWIPNVKKKCYNVIYFYVFQMFFIRIPFCLPFESLLLITKALNSCRKISGLLLLLLVVHCIVVDEICCYICSFTSCFNFTRVAEAPIEYIKRK